MRTSALITVAALVTLSCSSGVQPDAPEASPWSGSPLPPSSSPTLLAEWSGADNRGSCAPLMIDGSMIPSEATIRRANFGGGWGVAWDLPDGPGVAVSGRPCSDCGRGAFGIAGTGASRDGDLYEFPHEMVWDDGSRVVYGRDGSDTQWLAYLIVSDQECLYNVWSYRSLEHLESLIRGLRRVATD